MESIFLKHCVLYSTIRIWEFETGAPLQVLEGHENRVFRIQFDLFRIVSSSQDDTIRIWNFDQESIPALKQSVV